MFNEKLCLINNLKDPDNELPNLRVTKNSALATIFDST